jgi:hypothetical protein
VLDNVKAGNWDAAAAEVEAAVEGKGGVLAEKVTALTQAKGATLGLAAAHLAEYKCIKVQKMGREREREGDTRGTTRERDRSPPPPLSLSQTPAEYIAAFNARDLGRCVDEDLFGRLGQDPNATLSTTRTLALNERPAYFWTGADGLAKYLR